MTFYIHYLDYQGHNAALNKPSKRILEKESNSNQKLIELFLKRNRKFLKKKWVGKIFNKIGTLKE